jgi:hypothetical protein
MELYIYVKCHQSNLPIVSVFKTANDALMYLYDDCTEHPNANELEAALIDCGFVYFCDVDTSYLIEKRLMPCT